MSCCFFCKFFKLGDDRHKAPEILFSPEVIGDESLGIPDMIVNSIAKADIELRTQLYSSILLSGGSTLFPGFGQRLLNEVKRRAPRDTYIKLLAPPDRLFSPWSGGALLASLTSFKVSQPFC